MMHDIITVKTLLTHPVNVTHNITTVKKLLTQRVLIWHIITTLKTFLTHTVCRRDAQSFNRTSALRTL